MHEASFATCERENGGVRCELGAVFFDDAMIPGGFVLLVSIAAGFVGALTGMGGGVVLIPVLTFYGVDIKRAIAVSLLSIVVVSNSAASGYVRRHLPNFNMSAYLEVFAVLGSLVGALLTVASGRRPLFFLCGSLVLMSAATLWRQRKERWKLVTRQDALSRWLGLRGSYYDYAEKQTITYRGRRAALSSPLMFGTGLVSGWLGMGSSALTVLINDLVMGLPPKVSLTTSHLIIGVMALAGASIYLEAGLIDPQLAVPVILGVPLGALLGSKLLVGVTNQVARAIFLAALIVSGLELLMHGFRGVP